MSKTKRTIKKDGKKRSKIRKIVKNLEYNFFDDENYNWGD